MDSSGLSVGFMYTKSCNKPRFNSAASKKAISYQSMRYRAVNCVLAVALGATLCICSRHSSMQTTLGVTNAPIATLPTRNSDVTWDFNLGGISAHVGGETELLVRSGCFDLIPSLISSLTNDDK